MNVLHTLQKLNVTFVESHPSVSSKAFGVDCPFCDDNNKHCGIFKENGNYYCFKCGSKGSFFQILKKLTNRSNDEINEAIGRRVIASPKKTIDSIFKKPTIVRPEYTFDASEEKFLKSVDDNLPELQYKLLKTFMRHRNIDTKTLTRYGCKIGVAKTFFNRLVIPIPPPFISSNVEGYIGRDLTSKSDRKYIISKGFNVHEHIYPNMRKSNSNILIIVEGVLDVWASIFHMTYCMFGKEIHPKQFNIITENRSKFKRVIVAFDGDAKLSTLKTVESLKPFFERVTPLYMPISEDPSSLGYEFNNIVENLLHGKI